MCAYVYIHFCDKDVITNLMVASVIDAALYPMSRSGLTADPALPIIGMNMVKVV